MGGTRVGARISRSGRSRGGGGGTERDIEVRGDNRG
jgi:hypothetical protein